MPGRAAARKARYERMLLDVSMNLRRSSRLKANSPSPLLFIRLGVRYLENVVSLVVALEESRYFARYVDLEEHNISR